MLISNSLSLILIKWDQKAHSVWFSILYWNYIPSRISLALKLNMHGRYPMKTNILNWMCLCLLGLRNVHENVKGSVGHSIVQIIHVAVANWVKKIQMPNAKKEKASIEMGFVVSSKILCKQLNPLFQISAGLHADDLNLTWACTWMLHRLLLLWVC